MNAIEVTDVSKIYRRYGRRRHFGTLKSALLSFATFVLASLAGGYVYQED